MKDRFKCYVYLILSFIFVITILLSPAGTAAASTNLAAMQPGNTVDFAGYSWIVLDNGAASGSAYLLMESSYGSSRQFDTQYAPFDLNRPSNIASYLNTDFFNTLPNDAQAAIKLTSWTSGGQGEEASSSVNCKIGLISFSEYSKYGPSGYNIISNLNSANGWWTRTIYGGNSVLWYVDSHAVINGTRADESHDVRPAIYLDANLLISDGSIVLNPTPSINNATLSAYSGTVGTAQDMAINVTTIDIPDNNNVTVSLVDSNKTALNPPVSTAGTIIAGEADLNLNLPATLAAGSYYIAIAVEGVSDQSYIAYPINLPPAITNVTLNPSGNIAGIYQFVTVDVTTRSVNDGSWVTASLTDNNKNELNPAIAANNVTIASNNASLSFSVPTSLNIGNYYVKVSLVRIDAPVVYKPYTISATGISNTSLTPSSSLAGVAQNVTAAVYTNGIADETIVTASLVDAGKNPLNPAITVSGQINNNTANLDLNIPASLSAGEYYIMSAVEGIADVFYSSFTINPSCSISVLTNSDTGGSVTGGGVYAVGTQVTLTAVPNSGYTFTNWTNDNTVLSSLNPYEFVCLAPGNITLIANFAVIHHSSGQSSEATPVKPEITVPTVQTLSASNYSKNQITLNGLIESTGGAACTKVKFLYRQKGTSTWKETNPQSVSLDEGEQFSDNLTDFRSGVSYEYKAQAYNQKGWGDGQIITIQGPPAVVTLVSVVSGNIAVLKGAITDSGGLDITASGFRWSHTAAALESNQPGYINAANADPGDDGSLSFKLTGLMPNTTRYFQAYATNSFGTTFGDILSFKTEPILVTTKSASNIGFETANLQGDVLKTPGSSTITACGFFCGTGSDTSKYTKVFSKNLPDFSGHFTADLNALQPGQTYNFIAFVTTSFGDVLGSSLSFTALSVIPEVETRPVSNITGNTATLNGYITKNKGLSIIDSGFLYGTGSDADQYVKLSAVPGSDMRTLTYNLKGLTGNTTYFIKSYAANSTGIGYGKTISFTTPVMVPSVTTSSAIFDLIQGGAVLEGNIVSDGGAPITEHGFRLSSDQQTWINVVTGKEMVHDFTSTGVNSLDNLPPSTTFYVQAYANNAIGAGYGASVTFTTPGLPVLSAAINPAEVGVTTAVLSGKIINTGGQGVNCTALQYQYRLIGSKDWLSTGNAEGTFGPGPVSFNLTGLKPGSNYEFRVQAENYEGWGSSETISFTTTYGKTDLEAAAAMKESGFSVVDIANVLNRIFADTDSTAFYVLQYVGFGPLEIGNALKNSVYQDSADRISGIFYTNGVSSTDAAGVLQRIFFTDYRDVTYSLFKGGYSIESVTWALRNVFKNSITQTAAYLGGYNMSEVYSALVKVYGKKELVNFLWDKYDQGLVPFVFSLRLAGLDSVDATRILQDHNRARSIMRIMPNGTTLGLDSAELAKLLAQAGYSAAETGSALVQVLSLDPSAVYGDLTGFSSKTNLFPPDATLDFLVNSMQINIQQMAQVLGKWHPDLPVYDMSFLIKYYNPDAQEMVSALYLGGWTKAGLGENQIGLDIATYYLVNIYKIKTPEDIIAVLRQGGVSPLAIAQEMDAQMAFLAPYAHVAADTESWRNRWLTAYKQQGFTASDIASWGTHIFNSDENIQRLNQLHFSLREIVMAAKTVFNFNQVTAIKRFSIVNGYYKLGWSNTDINQAIIDVYGGLEMIPKLIAEMRTSGTAAAVVARTLHDTFAVSDAVMAANYMSQGGYNENDVLTALVPTYAPPLYLPSEPEEALQMLFRVESEVYHKNGINRYILSCIYSPAGNSLVDMDAHQAAAILTDSGFTAYQIAMFLNTPAPAGYGLSAENALMLLSPGGEPLAASEETASAITKAYNTDGIGLVVKWARTNGYPAGAALAWLDKIIGNIEVEAQYLKGKTIEGYSEAEVLTAIVNNRGYNDESVFLVLKNIYGATDAETMLKQVKQYLQDFAKVPQFMCKILMKLFNVDLKTVTLLIRDVGGIPVYSNVSGSWLEDVALAKDNGLASILGNSNPGDLNLPTDCAVHILAKMGYNFTESTNWLVKDNYAWEDMFKFQWSTYFPAQAGAGQYPIPALKALKGLYKTEYLAKGDYGFVRNYATVYKNLIAAGFSLQETATALLKIGGHEAMSSLVAVMEEGNVAKKGCGIPAPNMAAFLVNICLNTPDLSLNIEDIARSLLDYGPQANGGRGAYFSWDDLYNGMYVISGPYLEAKHIQADTNITALNILYLAGMSADEAAAVEAAEGVGLSAGDMLRSLSGFDSPWFEAVENLAAAGYGFRDSISAIWNNEDYHTLIGMSVLSSMITSSVSFLQMAPEISSAIKLYQNLDKAGFIINDTIKGDYKAAATKAGLLVLSNISMGGK